MEYQGKALKALIDKDKRTMQEIAEKLNVAREILWMWTKKEVLPVKDLDRLAEVGITLLTSQAREPEVPYIAKASVLGNDGERLAYVLNNDKRTKVEIAGLLDISRVALDLWTKKEYLHPKNVNKLLAIGIDIRKEERNGHLTEIRDKKFSERPGETRIPFYDTYVSAGIIKKFADQTISPSYFITIPHFLDCNLALRVSGDSMYPKYRNSDIVVCKEIKDKRIIMYNEPYVVITDDWCVVKYIVPNPGDKESVLLRSENNKHSDVEVKRDDILQLFLIKGKVELS